MNRRQIVLGSTGILTAAIAGCMMPVSEPKLSRPYSRQPFYMPRVSMDSVMRVIVGHRPYRPEGFRVDAENMDGKTIIHNYGHGGGGLSLGWGSSALAVRNVAGKRPGAAAVIGSGIMGLTTARLLQDAGWQVTIYTRDVYRHTTSNVAAGEWGPYSTHDEDVASDAFLEQRDFAARISHHAYTNLTGPRYGIRWLETYELRRSEPPPWEPGPINSLYPHKDVLAPGQHPFGDRWARSFVTMQIDPGTLLRQLVEDVQGAGGAFVIRNFSSLDEILSLQESTVFNCTGLGSIELFQDESLTPAKGQLVFLPPDPAVDFMTIGGGSSNLYMFPRTDVLLLGGTFKLGDWSRNAEDHETERIVREHQRIFTGAA